MIFPPMRPRPGKPLLEASREQPAPTVQSQPGIQNAAVLWPKIKNANGIAPRIPGRVIIISTLDNLVKGSAGQAIQNMNVMFGLEETTGIGHVALFP